jgi:bifunctional non-homologous end joining protein LigD
MPTSNASVVEIAGRQVRLSNVAKVYYPATGTTKGEVLDYYARIAAVLLPHFRDRAVTLVRYPDGVDGKHFYEKNCPSHRPPWVGTTSVPRGGDGRRSRSRSNNSSSNADTIDFCLLVDEAALLWAVNLGAIELHPYLHRADDIDRPTHMVFDLDPGPDRGLRDCARLALQLRDTLDELGLACVAKASGGKGVHLSVPLNGSATYEQTKPFALAIAQVLEQRDPESCTSSMSKAKRGGRVFIDWSQNTQSKTTAGVYSLRAGDRPRVSMPLTWDDIATIGRSRRKEPIDLSPAAALARVERDGDLWADVLTRKQPLPHVES